MQVYSLVLIMRRLNMAQDGSYPFTIFSVIDHSKPETLIRMLSFCKYLLKWLNIFRIYIHLYNKFYWLQTFRNISITIFNQMKIETQLYILNVKRKQILNMTNTHHFLFLLHGNYLFVSDSNCILDRCFVGIDILLYGFAAVWTVMSARMPIAS
jgi:hypothetical protein